MVDSVHICYIQLYVVSCCFIDLLNKCVFLMWRVSCRFWFGRMFNFDEGVFPRLLPDFLLSKFQHLPFSSCLYIYFQIYFQRYFQIYFQRYFQIYFHIYNHNFPYVSINFHIFSYISSIWMCGSPPQNSSFFWESSNSRAFFFRWPARLKWLSTYAPPMRMKRSMVISCQWQLTSGHGMSIGYTRPGNGGLISMKISIDAH